MKTPHNWESEGEDWKNSEQIAIKNKPVEDKSLKKGFVTRVVPPNLAYLKDEAGETHSFTFGRIKGYGGQYPEEIGLKIGTQVNFDTEILKGYGEVIKTVYLPQFPKKK